MADIQLAISELPTTAEALRKPPADKVKTSGDEESEVYSVFPAATRTYLTYLLGIVMTLSTLTATIYFPLIPLLSAQLGVSVQAINLTVTAYAVAQALTPALFASLADALGRRPVLLGLVALYAAASLGLAPVVAPGRASYSALLALRTLQSAGGSAAPAIAYGVVADVAPVSERGRMLGPMLSTCNALSAAGPVVGGAVALGTGDAVWVFLALFVLAVACFVLAGFTLPETARCVVGNGDRPAVGVWRTWWSLCVDRRGGRGAGRASESAPSPRVGENRGWHLTNVLASFRMIFYRDAAAVLWMVASSYSVYYTFQVAIPVIFAEIYGYNELQIGLVFLPGLAGMTIGGIIAGKLVDRNYAITERKLNEGAEKSKKKRGLGDFPIEAARYRNCLVIVFLEVVLVIGYGWAVYFRVHPSVPIILQFLICGSSTLLSHTASALLVDIFPDKSSSAYASGQIMRCGLSAASAALLQPLVDAAGRGWYFTMFALFVGVTGAASVAISRWKGREWRRTRQASPTIDGGDVWRSPLAASEPSEPTKPSSGA